MENEWDDRLVEVIEDGRIAKVPEFYAKREGLPVLRRIAKPKDIEEPKERVLDKVSLKDLGDKWMILDNFRKVDWKEKQVLSELVENFHWRIRVERRRKSLTRRQLAKEIGEKEEVLRMIENGRLPVKDFVLINKIQNVLGINLRRDKKDYSKSAREMIQEGDEAVKKRTEEIEKKVREAESGDVYGKDIEILGDF